MGWRGKALAVNKNGDTLSKMAKNLAKKRLAFVNEYLQHLNQTKAYITVYGEKKGASQSASRLMASADVKEEIERRTKGVFKKVEDAADQALEKMAVTSGNIIDSLAEMGLAHKAVAKFLKVSTGGDLYYDFAGATPEELQSIQPMIAELTVESYAEGRGENKREVIRTKLKFIERKGVLELLGRWKKLKMWSEQTEHTHLIFAENMTRRELEDYTNSGKLPERFAGQIPAQLQAGNRVIDAE